MIGRRVLVLVPLLVAWPLAGLSVSAGQTDDEVRDVSAEEDPDRLGIEKTSAQHRRFLRAGFTKYTEVVAPGGGAIRIFAQEGVRDIAVARARELLIFFLKDVPGSRWGSDKADVADTMAKHRATLIMPTGADGDGPEPRVPGQPLYEDETPVEGSRWYIEDDYEHRDAAFEEIFHLVHDNGIGVDRPGARPEYQEALLAEARAALEDRRWGIPIDPGVGEWIEELDEENSLAQEYIASVIDSYYGLWAAFDERAGGMWGIYCAKTRREMVELDPRGRALLEEFLPPSLAGYQALLDPEFEGTFHMSLDPALSYTRKSRYLVEARLTGTHDSGLSGNAADNRLAGNRGDNLLDGRDGIDAVVFRGTRDEYTLDRRPDGVLVVADRRLDRDGTDRLVNVERLVFADRTEEVTKEEPRRPEAVSLLGRPLFGDAGDARLLAALERELTVDPTDSEVLLRKGLALEDARRFREAVEIYSGCLVRDPTNVTMLRRRGHRYINLREHAAAVADLEKAAALHEFEKVESLGYKDNLHWAIAYYLGLAYSLQGRQEEALAAFRQSHAYCADNTSLLASTNWIHNVLRRLGRVEEAGRIVEPIGEGMGYSGNYYKNILVYKGLRKESEVFDEESARGFVLGTMGYGMACWRRVNGDIDGADRLLRKIAQSEAWHSNGVMAAEAELARGE